MRRYGPNGQDLQSVNLTDNSGTVMVQMVIICKARMGQIICGTVMVIIVKICNLKIILHIFIFKLFRVFRDVEMACLPLEQRPINSKKSHKEK